MSAGPDPAPESSSDPLPSHGGRPAPRGFAVALNTRAALLARDLIAFRRQLDAALETAPLGQAHITLRVSDEAFAVAAAKRAYRTAGAPYGEGDAALLRWAVEAERIGVRW